MKKYIFTLIALSMIFTATARKPKNTRTTEAAAREIAGGVAAGRADRLAAKPRRRCRTAGLNG